MERLSGFLRDMRHELASPVQIHIQTDAGSVPVEHLIGSQLTIQTNGEKACIHCGRKVKKLYHSGYCYPCFATLAECDLCIVKPHECHFHLGTCRDEEFAHSHCMIPHYVYLAFSSGVKVGLTRKGRELTRWMEQGAAAAVKLALVPDRRTAGQLEMAVAEFLPDKTDWRKMLKVFDPEVEDLVKVKEDVISRLRGNPTYQEYLLYEDDTVHYLKYPQRDLNEVKTRSVVLDKDPITTDILLGAKGQYLIFANGVLNVKRHAGYFVQISDS